jgi:hypothetical protein
LSFPERWEVGDRRWEIDIIGERSAGVESLGYFGTIYLAYVGFHSKRGGKV